MKKQLSNALDKAKEVWQSKKCQKMEVQNSPTPESPPGHHEDAVLRTGLDGTIFESGVSAAGCPTPKGVGLGFNL
jgi:hypothetical protein